jgi:hypothetical protein
VKDHYNSNYKTLMKERNLGRHYKMEKPPMFMDPQDIVKMAILPKII